MEQWHSWYGIFLIISRYEHTIKMCISGRYSQICVWVPDMYPPLIYEINLGSSHQIPSDGTPAKWINLLYIDQRYTWNS